MWIAARLNPGGGAIDATTGNGHDTQFLASQVGDRGRVFAFDIQAEAILQAQRRLWQAGLNQRVSWYLQSHQHMASVLPPEWKSRIYAVMFNLGYLPSGNKQVITRPATTVAALAQAMDLLAVGGRISVIAYTGHPGGMEEAQTLQSWLSQQPANLISWEQVTPMDRNHPPQLFLIEKQ